MRKQFTKTIQDILYTDANTALLLGDIGVYAFKNEITNLYPRVINAGILEQSMISVAAGLSLSGIIPFVHTIAPFITERAFEQIKIDFGYHKINGNFLSVGGTNDYAALGATHHCPGDVGLMLTIPEMEVFIPGSSREVDDLIKRNYNRNNPKYFRLSEYENDFELKNGTIIKTGNDAVVFVYGPMLKNVLLATENKNVTVVYLNTIDNVIGSIIRQNFNKKIIICEPFYKGTTNFIFTENLIDRYYRIFNIGYERKFIYNYGNKKQQDDILGLNINDIKSKIEMCINS